MDAGKELDALVAEKIFGITAPNLPPEGIKLSDDLIGQIVGAAIADRYLQAKDPKPYSTDIAAAWEVVEKLGRSGNNWFEVGRTEPSGKSIFCRISIWGEDSNYHYFSAKAESAPLAICLAALKAAEIK